MFSFALWNGCLIQWGVFERSFAKQFFEVSSRDSPSTFSPLQFLSDKENLVPILNIIHHRRWQIVIACVCHQYSPVFLVYRHSKVHFNCRYNILWSPLNQGKFIGEITLSRSCYSFDDWRNNPFNLPARIFFLAKVWEFLFVFCEIHVQKYINVGFD